MRLREACLCKRPQPTLSSRPNFWLIDRLEVTAAPDNVQCNPLGSRRAGCGGGAGAVES